VTKPGTPESISWTDNIGVRTCRLTRRLSTREPGGTGCDSGGVIAEEALLARRVFHSADSSCDLNEKGLGRYLVTFRAGTIGCVIRIERSSTLTGARRHSARLLLQVRTWINQHLYRAHSFKPLRLQHHAQPEAFFLIYPQVPEPASDHVPQRSCDTLSDLLPAAGGRSCNTAAAH